MTTTSATTAATTFDKTLIAWRWMRLHRCDGNMLHGREPDAYDEVDCDGDADGNVYQNWEFVGVGRER